MSKIFDCSTFWQQVGGGIALCLSVWLILILFIILATEG